MILTLLSEGISSALVITLLHSIWQIALVALIIRIILNRKDFSNSFKRSQLLMSGLVLILIGTISTFVYYYGASAGWMASTVESPGAITPLNTTTITPMTLHDSNPHDSSWQPLEWIMSYQLQIMITWLCGVALFALRILIGVIGMARIRRHLNYNLPAELQTLFTNIKSKLKAPMRLQVAWSNKVKVPMIMGHFKPIIVLPIAVINELTIEEVETILLHEIAHVLRKDYLQNFIVVTAETLFFFHPLLWWITSSLKQEREHSCDDFTVQHCSERITYAKTLVKVETLSHGAPNPMALALYSNQYSLMKRIQRIMETKQTRNFSNYRSGILAAFLLVTVALVGASWVSKEDSSVNHLVETNIDKLENKIEGIKKEIRLPNIGKIIHIQNDTTDLPEASERELEEARNELNDIRELLREKRDAQRDQMRELRERQEDEIRDQKERMRELKRKLRDSDDEDYDEWKKEYRRLSRDSDEWAERWSEEAEEWAERWSEEAEEWAERFEDQFDDEWIESMEDLGEEIAEQFDEEWEADMEAWGEEFARSFDESDFDFDFDMDEGWLEGLAEFSSEMAEFGAELGAGIGHRVAAALEDADIDFEDMNYDLNIDASNPEPLKKALAKQMDSDINLSNGKNSLVITDRTLKINGKLQSTQTYETYKTIIQQYEDGAFKDDARTKVKFHFYGDDFSDSVRIGLSVSIED